MVLLLIMIRFGKFKIFKKKLVILNRTTEEASLACIRVI